MNDPAPSAIIEVATKPMAKNRDAAARYRKYVSDTKAREEFKNSLLAKESLLPESADPASIRTGMKWPQVPLDKAAGGYTISFRKDIEPDVPWVAYAWDSGRIGPLKQDGVDWKAYLEVAKSWLDECSDLHEDCPRDQAAELPSRVLDVGPVDGSDEPKLVETSGGSDRYAALSYCWGLGQALTTTMANIEERKRRILLSACPPTIRDAILACRELSCRYLWIDALCIIQDSATDWGYEASRMQSVYRNSWVTIVAESADSTEYGFLHGRDTKLWDQKAPLRTRGWALQEDLLAPRRLTYHYDSLSFECQSILEEADLLSGCRKLESLTKEQSYDVWNTIVREYSRRYLTQEKDILPALSGLARTFQYINQDVYLAGLWKKQLLSGLLWNSEDFGTARPLLKGYRAPSWSWASHNGRTSYLVGNKGSKEIYVAEVLDAHTVLKGNDPFGQVTDGRIKIRSLLSKGRVSCHNEADDFETSSEWDGLFESEDSWYFEADDLAESSRATNTLPMVFLDDNTSNSVDPVESVYLLLIRMDRESDDVRNDRGLALKRISEDNSEYQRIGVFISPTGSRDAYFKGIVQTLFTI
jgi:hypothetical protein